MASAVSIARAPSPARWSRAQLISFRFAFAITALFSLYAWIVLPGYLYFGVLSRPVQAVVVPIATAQLRAAITAGGFILSRLSGDHSPVQAVVANYMQGIAILPVSRNTGLAAAAYMLGVAVEASLVTIVWSVVDRRRANYERAHRWTRVWARYTLALVAMVFAVVKVVPTQFGFLTPGEMLRPIGQLSHHWLLWDFMAASTSYTVFAGLSELLGVVLLFFRRTTAAGALLLGAAITNIVAMDIAYQVQGGGLIFALLLLTLDVIVLAPYLPAIVSFLFRARAATLVEEPGLVSRPGRHSPFVSAAICALLVFVRVDDGVARRRAYSGAGRAVYGLFDVDSFVRNGQAITPLASDSTTWKRVASDGRSGRSLGLTVQLANGDVRQFGLADDPANHVWTVRQGSSDLATFSYAIEPGGAVTLDGRIGRDSVRMRLRHVALDAFPLLHR